MLMKYASVSPDGTYNPPPASNAKASYATMVFVRATIVEEAGWVLARSATIATRYSAVRRQTAPRPGEQEWQVLDYQNTAHDLLPLVAVREFFSPFFSSSSVFLFSTRFRKRKKNSDIF
jgi:acyl-CoA oxidase